MSIEPRMRRLFAADGRCFDVAVDHGFFGEPRFLAGIENLTAALNVLVEAAPDAIQLSPGSAPLLQERPGPKPALVLRTDVANVYGPTVDAEAGYFSELVPEAIEQARRRGLRGGQPALDRRARGPPPRLRAQCRGNQGPLRAGRDAAHGRTARDEAGLGGLRR